MKTLALCLALCLFAPAALAGEADRVLPSNDIVGTVLSVEGLATVSTPNMAPGSAVVNMALHPGDMVATGPRARIFIQMLDNTELTLGENGQMTIDDYAYNDRDDSDNHAVYSVIKGAFLLVDGLIGKKPNPNVIVNVPVGSIGIRGTKFWGGEIDNDYGIIVGEGTIIVNTNAGSATLTQGQGTTISGKNYAPESPREWSKEKIDRATATVALKAPDIVGKRMQENAQRNVLLRERHREVLELRKKILGDKTGETSTDMDSSDETEARKRLLELRREKEKRLNGADAAGAAEATTTTVTTTTTSAAETARETVKETVKEHVEETAKKLGETLSTTVDGTRAPTTIVHATPLRSPNEAAAIVGDTVKTTTETTTTGTTTGAAKETVKENAKETVKALLKDK